MFTNAFASLFVVCCARLTVAETIVIEGGNTYFNPSSVNASVGDILEFHFLPNNHSVVMGNFSNPCQPASTGGFYSGFLPANEGENVRVSRENKLAVLIGLTQCLRPKFSVSPSTTRIPSCITARRMHRAIIIARRACTVLSISQTKG